MNKRESNEAGVALIMVLLLLLLFTVMMMGFYYVATGEQQVGASDRDNTETFYAAQGAIENMSSQLENYFAHQASPTPSDINALASSHPSIPIYDDTGMLTSQTINFPVYTIANLATPATTNPTTAACTPNTTSLCSTPGIIPGTGPLAGLMGILTPFQLTVVADGPNNAEVKMTRDVQAVAVPVFQFGIFSQTDLSFFAGPAFGFGGKTATNGNLFLAEGNGNTLTLNDKVTAYLNVIRTQLTNGTSTTATGSNYTGTVDITIGTAGGCPSGSTCGALATNQGSLTGGPGSSLNSNWKTISETTFKGYIESGNGGATGGTGAKLLNLALAVAGAPPIDMIERPCPYPTAVPSGEPTSCTAETPTSAIGQQRFFNQASIRILLSDTQSQITQYSTDGVTASNPYPLAEGASSGMGNVIQRTNSGNPYYLPAASACAPPVAESPGYTADHDYMSPAGTTLLGGYIKIEIQLNSNPGTWQDVTQEVLSLGISSNTETTGVVTQGTPSNASGGSLTASKTYYYEVTALGPWGESLPSTQVSEATTSSNKEIKLSWNAVTGATGYKVYRTTTSGNYTATGSGYIQLTVNTAQTGWASPWDAYTDSNATAVTSGAPPAPCTNNSILHLEEGIPGEILGTTSYTANTNYIPINIYDPREGEVRDSDTQTTVSLNGIMNILEVDVGHLQQWLAGGLVPPVSGCTGTAELAPLSGTVNSCGPLAFFNTGYILYVSDRRGNCNQAGTSACTGNDTGLYGNEDIINPASGTGTPNGVMDTAAAGTGSCPAGGSACPIEDLVGDGVFRTYGATPHALAIDSSSGSPWPAWIATMPATNPAFTRITATTSGGACPANAGCQAQKNSVVVFRRAVRLVDGTLGNLPPLAAADLSPCPNAMSPAQYPSSGGFSVATEGPLYIWGDYNASNSVGAFSPDPANSCHVPAAVFADAVTLLSDNWTDAVTFANPTNQGARPSTANNAWYRVAVIAGKNQSFPLPTFTAPAAPPDDFGTDGGTHNFLRYIENWGSNLNYLGALVSFYIAQQGTGIYKCCSTVYNPPTRNYAYDTDFTNITSLPPGTPRFTDVNALSYQQSVLSTQ